MKNIHNQSVDELAHCIMIFYTQELGTWFFHKRILVWHLFFLGFLMPMLRYLIKSQVGNQGTLPCGVA